jgi:glycosyltransferase involved in cell wall biosynthesis
LLFHRPDVALYCNGATAVFTILPRMAAIPVALNVDGLERLRKKWNWLARSWYLLSERLSTILPNEVVTDAQSITAYYRTRYGKRSTFIPYGAETGAVPAADELPRLGLEVRRYFLYVSRMEPENNALLVRQAFESVATELKLALIGDAPYAQDYIRQVRDTADPRVVIPGAVYGQAYHELTSHCFAYIHATEVGGTHPALIEAMGRGALTLFLETRENEEVAGGVAIPFRRDNLAGVIRRVLAMDEEERAEWRRRARERVATRYSWDAVTDQYEALLARLAGRNARDSRRPAPEG